MPQGEQGSEDGQEEQGVATEQDGQEDGGRREECQVEGSPARETCAQEVVGQPSRATAMGKFERGSMEQVKRPV